MDSTNLENCTSHPNCSDVDCNAVTGNEELLIVMQTEDDMVSLERSDRSTIILPITVFSSPELCKEGNIIRAVIYDDETVEFRGVDTEAMKKFEAIRPLRTARSKRLRDRARRSSSSNPAV